MPLPCIGMATKCGNCGAVLPLGRSSCPQCGLLTGNAGDDPGLLSQEQEDRISQRVSKRLGESNGFLWSVSWRAFAWFFGLLGLAFGWGILSAVQTLNRLAATRFDNLDRNMSNLVAEAHARISSNIVDQFQEPRIRRTVEDVASKESKAILQSEVQPTVNRFRDDAEFLRLATRARAYDFKAYLQLFELKKQTNDLAHYAEEVIAETDRSLERDRSQFMPRRTLVLYSGTNAYSGPFTSDELALMFGTISQDKTAYNREGFVNTVGELHESLFLGLLMVFLANETDLEVADRVTIAISTITKEDFHPRDFERIQTWWHSHENEYTNWPSSQYGQGLMHLVIGGYSEAAGSFRDVLKIDPAADMSRAFAIGSLLQIGQTNKAVELAKGFKSPTGRWAQWAAAKAELETGNVSNATVQFGKLTRDNPTILMIPQEGNDLFKKIDWKLFREVTSGVRQ
jgi:hypothetical protein